MSEHPTSFSGLFPKKQEAAPVQEPAWYHAECNDPDYSRFTQEKDEAFAIVSDKGGYVTELYAKAQQAPVQEPVAWTVSGKITDWSKDFSAYQTKHYTRPVYTPSQAQRQWVGLMRGVRVEGDTVVITAKGGNDAARELCAALIQEKNA
jgi:hypothetical protein